MRIDALAGKIEEARGLRREAVEDAGAIFPCAVDQAFNSLRSATNHCGIASLSEVEEVVTSGPRNFASQYRDSGIRFYRAQDISAEGRITEDNVVWVELPAGMSTRAIVGEGDIFIVITGATAGRSAVVMKEHPDGLVSQHVGLVRVNKQNVEPRFLHYAILSPSWAGGQNNEAKYGQGKPGLNLDNLRSLRFPCPSISEQLRIVEYLDGLQSSVDTLKHLQAKTASELDALLPSILDKAFKGGL